MRLNLRSTALLVSTLIGNYAMAGTMGPVVVENYNGFYIGGDVGVSSLVDKQVAFANSITKLETHHLGEIGFVGGGLIGYDYSLTDVWKLGIEGFINGNSMDAKAIHNFNFTAYRAKARYNAGVRVLPGYQFASNANAHILLGYSNAKYRVNDTGAYGLLRARDFNKGGFQAGLGATADFTPNFLVRLDGLYTTYGKKRHLGNLYNAINGPAGAGTGVGFPLTTLNPYRDTFQTLEGNLTFIYKFV